MNADLFDRSDDLLLGLAGLALVEGFGALGREAGGVGVARGGHGAAERGGGGDPDASRDGAGRQECYSEHQQRRGRKRVRGARRGRGSLLSVFAIKANTTMTTSDERRDDLNPASAGG